MIDLALARFLHVERAASGEQLALRLGVSRAAVWKRIEALRAAGLPVVAERGRGYRLSRAFDWLDADAIGAALAPNTRRRLAAIEVLPMVDSTMATIAAAAARGADSGHAVFAEYQRAGRGRQGRQWLSPLASQISFSVLWRFDCGLGALTGLGIAIGVAVADALAALGVEGVALKWPNDVQVDGRKLAGILIEAGGEWSGPCHALIGVGVNWNLGANGSAIDQAWTDVASAGGSSHSRNQAAAALLGALSRALGEFDSHGVGGFVARWQARDALFGQAVAVREGERTWHGVAHGIAVDGRLKVSVDGVERRIAAAEVSVRVLR